MRIVALYHPASDTGRIVEEYAHDFERIATRSIELVSLETKVGSDTAQLYDIVRYPALLVIQDNDQLIKSWEGDPLPLVDEIISYLQM